MAALRVLLAASALALPLWVAATTTARACTGSSVVTLDDRVSAADVVVIGVPTQTRLFDSVHELPPLPSGLAKGFVPAGPGETAVTVVEYLKGSGPPVLSVFQPITAVHYVSDAPPELTGGIRTDCDYFLDKGEQHLLFLSRRDDGRYETSVPAGSASLARLGAEREERLNEIRATVASHEAHSSPWMTPLVAAALAGVALASAALLIGRRRES